MHGQAKSTHHALFAVSCSYAVAMHAVAVYSIKAGTLIGSSFRLHNHLIYIFTSNYISYSFLII